MKIFIDDVWSTDEQREEHALFGNRTIHKKGGGGGSSGKVDFPDHMKVAHKDWLDNTGTDTMTFSVVDLMNTAMTGASPYNGYSTIDPDDAFFEGLNTVTDYRTPYDLLDCFDRWSPDTAYTAYLDDLDTIRATKKTAFEAAYDADITGLIANVATYLTSFNTQYDSYNAALDTEYGALNTAYGTDHATKITDVIAKIATYLASFNTQYDSYNAGLDTDFGALLTSLGTKYDGFVANDDAAIAAAVAAESALLDDEINLNVLPKFKAGMANINATMGSSFVGGTTVIWDSKEKAVAKFDAEARLLRLKDGKEHALERVKAEYGLADAHINAQHIIQFQRATGELDAALKELVSTQEIAQNFVTGRNTLTDEHLKSLHAIQMDRARTELEMSLKELLATHELALKHEAMKNDSVNSELQLESQSAIQRIGALTEWRRIVTTLSGEFARLYLAAKNDDDENVLDIAHKDAVWDMEMYTYGTQVMAAISGTASTVTKTPRTSTLGSAIGGTMSGAAIGANPAMMAATGGTSMMIGAALGFAGGLFG